MIGNRRFQAPTTLLYFLYLKSKQTIVIEYDFLAYKTQIGHN